MKVVLIVLLGFLQIADGTLTYLGLSFANADEVNPLLNFCSGLFGLGYSITLLKLGTLAAITFLFLERHKMKSRWIMATLASVDTYYAWIVVSNVILVMDAYLPYSDLS